MSTRSTPTPTDRPAARPAWLGEERLREERRLESLLDRYAAGEERAFDELYAALAPELTRRLRRMLRTKERVEDALQVTFMNIHRGRRLYRPGTSVRAWSHAIAQNAARDMLRRSAPVQVCLDESPAAELRDEREDALDRLQAQERSQALALALSELPERHRRVVQLHKLEDVPLPEIAEQLGLAASTARVWAHRGYQRLREVLSEGRPELAAAWSPAEANFGRAVAAA
jgi:RNA polymerase sigma-70 factor (ECF subfamily)